MGTLGEMPLVGRDGLVDRMRSQLSGPRPVAFVLAGPAGVGKTRLAAEVAGSTGDPEGIVARVVATRSAASIPFGAFAPLLGGTEDEPTDSLLTLLKSATAAIVARCQPGQRLLLVVDDAHLLDDGSAALVHQLVQQEACSLVATVRTPSKAPDPIVSLWKDALAERLDLDALSEADTGKLVTSTLGGPATGPTLRWLWSATAGNPLYLRELLVGAAATSMLSEENGMWTLKLPMTPPERLTELIASRLEDLPEAAGEVVDLLALGEPLPVSMLEAAVSVDAVEEAEARKLISVADEEVRLCHPLYAEVRRSAIPRSQARRLSTILAEAFLSQSPRGPELELRIARWQLDSGHGGDPDLLARAATSARRRYDFTLAERLGRGAVAAGGGIPAGLALAETLFFSGHHRDAEEVLSELAPQCASDDEIAHVAHARAYNLGILMGDHDAAARILDSAIAQLGDDHHRYRLLATKATSNLWGGFFPDALAAATEIVEKGPESTFTRGSYVGCVALAMMGRTSEAVELARRGEELQRRLPDPARAPEAQLIGAILGHAGSGDLLAAERDASRGYESTLHSGDKDATGTFALLSGLVHVERGLLGPASRSFREAVTLHRELDDLAVLRWSLGGLALAEGLAGNAGPAADALAELDGLDSHWWVALNGDLIDRGRAWALAAAGEYSAARSHLELAADRAAASQQFVTEARLRHDMVRLGFPEASVRRLAELADVVDGTLVRTFADHAAGRISNRAPDLEACAASFEQSGALVLAAEVALSASDAYRAAGLDRLANACRRNSEHLSEQCGSPRAPGTGGHREQLRLTRREQEVAALAASGAASKEIADKLFLSVRTVENHLQRVYTKLGVSTREDLRDALGSLS